MQSYSLWWVTGRFSPNHLRVPACYDAGCVQCQHPLRGRRCALQIQTEKPVSKNLQVASHDQKKTAPAFLTLVDVADIVAGIKSSVTVDVLQAKALDTV